MSSCSGDTRRIHCSARIFAVGLRSHSAQSGIIKSKQNFTLRHFSQRDVNLVIVQGHADGGTNDGTVANPPAVLEFRQLLSIEILEQLTLVCRLARLFSFGIGAPRISTSHFLTTLMNTSFCWRTTRDKSVIYSRMFFTAKNMLIL